MPVSTATNGTFRGRPKVLQRAQIDFPGGPVKFALINVGESIQIDVPGQWRLDTIAHSTLKSGDKTKITLSADAAAAGTGSKRSKTKDVVPDPLTLDLVSSEKDKVVVTSALDPEGCVIALPGIWRVRTVATTPARTKIVIHTNVPASTTETTKGKSKGKRVTKPKADAEVKPEATASAGRRGKRALAS